MNEISKNPVIPDQILAQMAQEVPEMPADFHARWTEQIRAEAAGNRQQDHRQESRRQWRYILSAAAVFVFLIGGTLLTRSMEARDRMKETSAVVYQDQAVTEQAAEEETEREPEGAAAVNGSLPAEANALIQELPEDAYTAAAAFEDAEVYEAAAAYEEAEAHEEAGAYEAAESAMADDTAGGELLMEEAAEAPAMMNMSAAASETAQKTAGKAGSETEAEADEEWAAAFEEDEMYEAAEAPAMADTELIGTADEPMMTAMGSAAATATAAPTAAEAALAEPAPDKAEPVTEEAETTAAEAEPAAAAEEESEFVSFLKDFGIFTLKTLAVAAAAAAIVFGVLALRRRFGKTK